MSWRNLNCAGRLQQFTRSDEQRRLLRLMRCDEMQGYQHSRPMPREELEELLRLQAESFPRLG